MRVTAVPALRSNVNRGALVRCTRLARLIRLKLSPQHRPQQQHSRMLTSHRSQAAAAPAKVCSSLLDVAVVERGSQGQQGAARDQLHDQAASILHPVQSSTAALHTNGGGRFGSIRCCCSFETWQAALPPVHLPCLRARVEGQDSQAATQALQSRWDMHRLQRPKQS